MKGIRQNRAQKSSVRYENDVLTRMSGSDFLQFSRGSFFYILKGLPSRRLKLIRCKENLLSSFWPLGADLLEGKTFPLAKVHFPQIFRLPYLAAKAFGNKPCRRSGTLQITRIDGINLLCGKMPGEAFSLFHTFFCQGNIRMPLKTTAGIPLGQSMSNKINLCHTASHSFQTSCMTSSNRSLSARERTAARKYAPSNPE